MRLSALIASLPPELAAKRFIGSSEHGEELVVCGLAYDSRDIAPGDVFFALRGASVDGHDYLEQALDLGAAALCVEELPKDFDLRGRVAVVVSDTRRALAPMSVAFFGAPSQDLLMLGVTGTNGKTSVTYLCESILGRAGRRVGLLGTVEIRYGAERLRATNTTPESLDLQQTLRAMHTAGIDSAVMEVSSHGLELGRVSGCDFDIACFTNLTQDHLDFHGDMEAYRVSKERLFRFHLAPGARAVVNIDDQAGASIVRAAESANASVLRVSRHDASADIFLEEADVGIEGSRACVRTPAGSLDVTLPLVGAFNLENMLVACGAGIAAEIPLPAIREGIDHCPQVPGRMERVGADLPQAPTVLVDYAHTPDAVEKVLASLRPLCSGRLIAVFGCGGDRDRAKRSLMAEAVARYADRIVATSDNPRTEDPERILDDVVQGLGDRRVGTPSTFEGAENSYLRVGDRREAILAAIAIARPQDTVVLAGKGHEDYQIIGRERLPFDDREEARRALLSRGGNA